MTPTVQQPESPTWEMIHALSSLITTNMSRHATAHNTESALKKFANNILFPVENYLVMRACEKRISTLVHDTRPKHARLSLQPLDESSMLHLETLKQADPQRIAVFLSVSTTNPNPPSIKRQIFFADFKDNVFLTVSNRRDDVDHPDDVICQIENYVPDIWRDYFEAKQNPDPRLTEWQP